MPIIKSSKKRAKQNVVRQERNYKVRSKVHTYMKKVADLVKSNNVDQAEKLLPDTYKEIDMAAKKNIIHKNNAGRKKSLMARTVNNAKKTA